MVILVFEEVRLRLSAGELRLSDSQDQKARFLMTEVKRSRFVLGQKFFLS